MAQNDNGALHADLVACNSYEDGPAAAANISQPSLCLLAAKDRMTPIKFGKQLAQTITGAQTLVFDRAGHFLPAEFPIEVNSAIAAFLAR